MTAFFILPLVCPLLLAAAIYALKVPERPASSPDRGDDTGEP